MISYLGKEGQLRIEVLDDLLAKQCVFVLLENVGQLLASFQHAGGKVWVVAEPHLGVKLVILNLEIGAGRPGAQLGSQ